MLNAKTILTLVFSLQHVPEYQEYMRVYNEPILSEQR
jgi:hypothetical protein